MCMTMYKVLIKHTVLYNWPLCIILCCINYIRLCSKYQPYCTYLQILWFVNKITTSFELQLLPRHTVLPLSLLAINSTPM